LSCDDARKDIASRRLTVGRLSRRASRATAPAYKLLSGDDAPKDTAPRRLSFWPPPAAHIRSAGDRPAYGLLSCGDAPKGHRFA